MGPNVSSPARYRAEDRTLFIFVPLVLLFLIMQFGLSHFHVHPAGPWAVLCAAVGASPMIAMILNVGFYLAEEKDEFQRSLFVQSILWGLGVAACVTVCWFALGTFIHVPRMNFVSGELLFLAGMAIAGAVSRWRYK